ncbi:hypothetical protein M3Y99_01994900 [Aphelenchoides fujianensis]|nr:hypothetical protein M3Y99_01994900 [Aphelenchoides fujianensis]
MVPPTSARHDYEATFAEAAGVHAEARRPASWQTSRSRRSSTIRTSSVAVKLWGADVERTRVSVEGFTEWVRSGKSHAPRKRKKPAGQNDEEEDEEESRPSTSAPKGRFLEPSTRDRRPPLPGGTAADLPKGRFARLLIRLLCSQFGLECEQEADRPADWPKEWALPSLNTKHTFDYFLSDRYTPENLKFIDPALGDELLYPQWKRTAKGMLGELGFCNNFLEDCFFVYRRELLPFVARDTITRKRRRNRGLRDAAARKYDRTPFLHDTGKLQLRFTGNSVAFFTQEVHRDDDFRTPATNDFERSPPACEMPLCSSSLLLQAFDGACELENESGRTYNAEQLNTTINDANEGVQADGLSAEHFVVRDDAQPNGPPHAHSAEPLDGRAASCPRNRANFFDPQFVEPRNELERNPAGRTGDQRDDQPASCPTGSCGPRAGVAP